jgi:hypothetical protein
MPRSANSTRIRIYCRMVYLCSKKPKGQNFAPYRYRTSANFCETSAFRYTTSIFHTVTHIDNFKLHIQTLNQYLFFPSKKIPNSPNPNGRIRSIRHSRTRWMPTLYWIPHHLFWKERNANSEHFWLLTDWPYGRCVGIAVSIQKWYVYPMENVPYICSKVRRLETLLPISFKHAEKPTSSNFGVRGTLSHNKPTWSGSNKKVK